MAYVVLLGLGALDAAGYSIIAPVVPEGIGAGGLWIGIVFAVLERFPGEEYRRLTGITAAYSLGSIAGPAMGGAGGISGPFLIHLAVVLVLVLALGRMGVARKPAAIGSDREALWTPGFWLASAGILLVALALGAFDGPLLLHFAERLGQSEIAARGGRRRRPGARLRRHRARPPRLLPPRRGGLRPRPSHQAGARVSGHVRCPRTGPVSACRVGVRPRRVRMGHD